jgi:hypothetical protein
VIPPEQDAEFVACMEDVLDLYQQPYDPSVPLVCMDEKPVQLLKDKKEPISAKAGKPKREDYEYEREGVANIFLFTEPMVGRDHLNIRKRKAGIDWANEIKDLLDVYYPDVKRICLVCDNLKTHTIASLYKAFPAEEARRMARRLEIHYTPKHGSWLNIAEIELHALNKQCLDRRIPDVEVLSLEAKAWEKKRNDRQKPVDWRFTTADARIKLKRLYPLIQLG